MSGLDTPPARPSQEALDQPAGSGLSALDQRVAVVIVTFNRADLLRRCLDGLARQTRPPDSVIVVDNASADHTRAVIEAYAGLPMQPIHAAENLGGAGGFELGVRTAYAQGNDRIWLMDDDVVPAPDCLATLLAHPGPCLMAVREDTSGRLCEKAAITFDLTNPLAIRPKRQSVEEKYGSRAAMPAEVPIQNVAFEGFMVAREVIDAIGLPDPAYFIFYDDVDFALRARRAGFPIVAVRDAVLVRQLDFDQQHDTRSWKGYYMYRNLFLVHQRYGANVLVRWKPLWITLAVLALAPLRGGRAEARNVWQAWRDSRRMAAAGPGVRLPGAPRPPR
ncbi:MAG: glycosyltransferase family 2 protein [Nocardioidaceae bacterium]